MVLVVLIVLYVASQLGSTLLMSASAEPSQRWMMIALPLFFVVILFRYPAGLLLYWIVTNLWTVAQGYFVRRSIGAPPPAPDKGAGSPGPGDRQMDALEDRVDEEASRLWRGGGWSASAPPPPPRKKKKRSGRRR